MALLNEMMSAAQAACRFPSFGGDECHQEALQ